MGEVYLAEDTVLQREVALKLLRSSAGGANFVRRFRQEERILAGLSHPNIARLTAAARRRKASPISSWNMSKASASMITARIAA